MTQRKQHWDKVYRDKSPVEVSWFQQLPALSLEYIEANLTDHHAAIIDVGGGASSLAEHLLTRGYTNVAVLDISANAIALAQARMGQRAEQVEWLVQDVTHFQAPRKFAFWHDRAVFHFLTEAEDRQLYLENMHQALQPGGNLLIASFAIGGPQKCSGLDIVQYDAEKIKNLLGSRYTLCSEKHEIHITPENKQQSFNYFHFKKIV